MNNLSNITKLKKSNNIETYEANLKILVKKIETKDEIQASLYMDILLNNKNSRKIYDIIKDDKNNIYVYLDPKEDIDDLLNENDINIIKQANKGGPPSLTLKNLEEIFGLEKAMCKIKFSYADRGKLIYGFGSGCFIQLEQEDFPLKKFLLTNNHVLDEKKIKGNKELDIVYKNKIKKINLLKRRRFTNKYLDYTCIEIFDEDNIEQFYYIDQRIFENNPQLFIKEDIYILHYPMGGDLTFSPGKILGIKDSNILHNCSTEGGSSGSPIISRYNSSIIGLHFAAHKKKNYNIAKEISYILNDIKQKSKNTIVAEFEIKTESINKDIKIINSFEQSMLEEGKIDIEEKDEKYMNEEQIKENCIIEINNKSIPFSYYYKFSEEGRIIIKYSFINNLDNINSLFRNCSLLKSIDLTNFDNENVTNLNFMFSGCNNLERITFWNFKSKSKFNTENVTEMENMFCGCYLLSDMNLLNFNTKKVTNMSYMFAYCRALQKIDLSKFDTKNVINMSWMFYDCSSLQSLNLSHFNTENVTDMSFMFCGCKSMHHLDLSSFNTEKVITMNTMFGECHTIPELYLSSFKTNNTENMMFMFSNCTCLTALDISNFTTEKIHNISRICDIFKGCNSLLLCGIKVKDQNIIDEYNYEDKKLITKLNLFN